jgi:hypothetical protein
MIPSIGRRTSGEGSHGYGLQLDKHYDDVFDVLFVLHLLNLLRH